MFAGVIVNISSFYRLNYLMFHNKTEQTLIFQKRICLIHWLPLKHRHHILTYNLIKQINKLRSISKKLDLRKHLY